MRLITRYLLDVYDDTKTQSMMMIDCKCNKTFSKQKRTDKKDQVDPFRSINIFKNMMFHDSLEKNATTL